MDTLPRTRIVFDLDGTLIDSAPDIRQVANGILAAEGAPPLTLEETRSFIGEGAAVFVERMMAARGLSPQDRGRILPMFLDRYEHAVELTLPYPGVVAALERLAEDGHEMGLCTNKPEAPTRAVLRHLKLDRFFTAVVGGDSLASRKPDAAPLLATLEAMGTGPAIYVGDSEIDARTAEAAKVPFLLFTEGYRKAAADDLTQAGRFSTWGEMPRLLRHARG